MASISAASVLATVVLARSLERLQQNVTAKPLSSLAPAWFQTAHPDQQWCAAPGAALIHAWINSTAASALGGAVAIRHGHSPSRVSSCESTSAGTFASVGGAVKRAGQQGIQSQGHAPLQPPKPCAMEHAIWLGPWCRPDHRSRPRGDRRQSLGDKPGGSLYEACGRPRRASETNYYLGDRAGCCPLNTAPADVHPGISGDIDRHESGGPAARLPVPTCFHRQASLRF